MEIYYPNYTSSITAGQQVTTQRVIPDQLLYKPRLKHLQKQDAKHLTQLAIEPKNLARLFNESGWLSSYTCKARLSRRHEKWQFVV